MNPELWLTFALVSARLVGLIGLFSQMHLPFVTWRMRLAAAVTIGACLCPAQGVLDQGGVDAWLLGSLALRELLIGGILGLLSGLLVAGFQWAGRWIARLGDFDLDEWLGDGGGTGPIAHLYTLLAGAVFFGLGGHRLVIAAFLESLSTLPVGAAEWPSVDVWLLADFAAEALALGLRVAAPVLAALAAAQAVVALVHRVLPHVPAMALAAPLKSIVTILLVAASLSLVPLITAESWSFWPQRIAEAFAR